jgi:hypothetical protein
VALFHVLGSLCRTTTLDPQPRWWMLPQTILAALAGRSMHDRANGLLRIPLPRTSVNKAGWRPFLGT